MADHTEPLWGCHQWHPHHPCAYGTWGLLQPAQWSSLLLGGWLVPGSPWLHHPSCSCCSCLSSWPSFPSCSSCSPSCLSGGQRAVPRDWVLSHLTCAHHHQAWALRLAEVYCDVAVVSADFAELLSDVSELLPDCHPPLQAHSCSLCQLWQLWGLPCTKSPLYHLQCLPHILDRLERRACLLWGIRDRRRQPAPSPPPAPHSLHREGHHRCQRWVRGWRVEALVFLVFNKPLMWKYDLPCYLSRYLSLSLAISCYIQSHLPLPLAISCPLPPHGGIYVYIYLVQCFGAQRPMWGARLLW